MSKPRKRDEIAERSAAAFAAFRLRAKDARIEQLTVALRKCRNQLAVGGTVEGRDAAIAAADALLNPPSEAKG